MAVTVTTREELKRAIQNKEKDILITDPYLAKNVKQFKTIKKLTKWTLCLLLAGSGATMIGVALAPATGGTSAVVGLGTDAVFKLVLASGASISTGAITAIGCLCVLGAAVLFALWKDYTVEIDKLGPVQGIRLKRT